MTRHPIVDEVRSARQKIFEACNEDLDALLDRFQEQEQRDRAARIRPRDVTRTRCEGAQMGPSLISLSYKESCATGY